ncbi:hypothetical protein [Mycolicibacterium rhodesiae]|uniref:Uncharacterized protein n=1 Tax=Mycolicibacterium rhodesiae TaxID=36814 RepID=A0A1X0ITZ4_MYCRH|nr:hypothetical protein [Mycolicibacterium rhodesiae]MCV7345890.1 hypothetical protein [Mycolicibacterium rhodesiae]ORB52203.1 hypothetical protein BST42_14580 [Mycolicibacterium rhodesiae]
MIGAQEGPGWPHYTCTVLLIADPGVPARLAERTPDWLSAELADRRNSPVRWETSVQIESHLRHEQASFAEVIESVAPLERNADVVIYMTDLPRRDGTLPVLAEISAGHRFGLICVAGVGAAFVTSRVRALVLLAVAVVADRPELLPQTAARLPATETCTGVRYFAPRGLRRFRLLAGMVRANRPWRLVVGLSKVLVVALGSGALGLATDTIWRFADTMGPWRMSATTVLSIGAMVTWLILDHELWERPESSAARTRSRLYNIATVITLIIGVVVLHVALFLSMLFTAGILLTPDVFAQAVGHPVSAADYLWLAWLIASIATVGGALGSGLEDDGGVRAAAYGIRQRQRFAE